VLTAVAIAAACCTPSADAAYAFARATAAAGPRPAASQAERRAQRRVEERFKAAGLRVDRDGFRVPGKGRSRNVVGTRDTPRRCLDVVMAHSDSVPPAPGANDNASGLGALVGLAALTRPRCDLWLIATGAEERPYTRRPDHLGALAVVRRIRRANRTRDVRVALSLDEVGRGREFWLRSRARRSLERRILGAATRANVKVRWLADSGSGNSDHRELALAGIPAAKLGVPNDACRHAACDVASRLSRPAFDRVLRVVERVLRQ
jgi:hypothetical protein